jgi:acetolactate synthase-1/2/3 large subunit
VILITGQVPRAAMGTDAFQEAPVFNIMAPCAKHVFLVTDETKMEETMRRAFDIARSGRPGPVVVDVPKDVQNAMGVFKGSGLLPVRGYQERVDALGETQVTPSEAEAFFKLLGKAERPLLYVRRRCHQRRGGARAPRLRRALRHPGRHDPHGHRRVDTTSDLSLQMLGMHGMAYANYAGRGLRLPLRDRLALRRPRRRQGEGVRPRRHDRAPRHRRLRDREGEARRLVARRRRQARPDPAAEGGRGFKKDFSRWRDHVAKLKSATPSPTTPSRRRSRPSTCCSS